MKEIPVSVVAVYNNPFERDVKNLRNYLMQCPDGATNAELVALAIQRTEGHGDRVMPNSDGGRCEYVTRRNEEYISITVYPSEAYTPRLPETGSETIHIKIAREYCRQAAAPDTPIACAIDRALSAGRAWQWNEAEKALDRAYLLAGGKNPATGYAWHQGIHPLQAALQQAEKEYGVEEQ